MVCTKAKPLVFVLVKYCHNRLCHNLLLFPREQAWNITQTKNSVYRFVKHVFIKILCFLGLGSCVHCLIQLKIVPWYMNIADWKMFWNRKYWNRFLIPDHVMDSYPWEHQNKNHLPFYLIYWEIVTKAIFEHPNSPDYCSVYTFLKNTAVISS